MSSIAAANTTDVEVETHKSSAQIKKNALLCAGLIHSYL
jgi:hypothetical protein